jgi:prepilin-type N-terminal cleavage/methylation domain-containing protein
MHCNRRKQGFNLLELLVAIAIMVTLTATMLLPSMWQEQIAANEADQIEPGTGLTGIYYSGSDFTGTSHTRIDDQIDFNWGPGGPNLWNNASRFSATWVGMLRSDFDEEYTLYIEADDGVRLFVDSRTAIDAWGARTRQTHQTTTTLSPDTPVSLTLNLQKRHGSGGIRLFWSSPSTPKQVIPSANLFPAIRDTVSTGRRVRGVQ